MKLKRLLLPFIIITAFSVPSCAGTGFDTPVDLVVMNVENPDSDTYVETYRTKISIFNSAILPSNPASQWKKDQTFLGYSINDFQKGVSKKKDFYKEKDIVRYNDVKQYIVNGTVTIKAQYCAPEDYPSQYLVIGWYAKTNTSGLDTTIMAKFETMLRSQYSDKDYDDLEVRAYEGDVATIGGDIMFDNDVDIFIGAGVNLGTTGGVTYVKRNAYEIKGVADRYIYQLNEKESTVAAYEWMRSTEIKNYFKGK